MGQVVRLPNNLYKPITNTAWVRARLCKLQKGCTRLAAASDKVDQLLAHGRLFSPGTPASSTTKTGRHDIAEILLKVALNTKNLIKSNLHYKCTHEINDFINFFLFLDVLIVIPLLGANTFYFCLFVFFQMSLIFILIDLF